MFSTSSKQSSKRGFGRHDPGPFPSYSGFCHDKASILPSRWRIPGEPHSWRSVCTDDGDARNREYGAAAPTYRMVLSALPGLFFSAHPQKLVQTTGTVPRAFVMASRQFLYMTTPAESPPTLLPGPPDGDTGGHHWFPAPDTAKRKTVTSPICLRRGGADAA